MKHRFEKLMCGMVSAMAIGLIYTVFYIQTGMGIPCLFRMKTGLLCPSCGVTRMIVCLVRLNFKEAFGYNQLIFCMLPLIIFYIIRISIEYVKHGKFIPHKIDNVVFYTVITLFMIFGILRNI